MFGFVLAQPSGRHGQIEISYGLSVSGPAGSGCRGSHAMAVSATRPAERLQIAIGPAQLSGPWCVGRYVARVDELTRPVCAEGQACPQFIALRIIAGPAPFVIRG